MKKRYYSNGKLLLTGEYVVLDGATALALPTKFGQDLIVEPGSGRQIQWKSIDSDGSIWFEDIIHFDAITNKDYVQQTDNVRNTLIEILHEAYLANPDYINGADGYTITTNLTFPKFWGLGTSSTLINNIAQWLGIDAFQLLQNSFGGSGYDIASAQHDTPILYKIEHNKPVVRPVKYKPDFHQHLYFVYLNKKQSSKGAIASYYKNKPINISKIIGALDNITAAILNADEITTLAYELQKHENIISDIMEMQTVREAFFSDFNGVIKSLGGWGGDFILAVTREDPTLYFRTKGFHTVIPFQKMIL